LEACCEQGQPVIVPVQDYGSSLPDDAQFNYGHYLTVIAVALGYVFCQDSSEDNVTHDSGSVQAPGRVMIAADEFLKIWHDRDVDGKEYIQYGIAVGKTNPKCSCGCNGVKKEHKGHSKVLPDGKALEKCLKNFFAKQCQRVIKSCRRGGGKADGDSDLLSRFLHLSQWDTELYVDSQPLVELCYKNAYKDSGAEVVARAGISPDVFDVTSPHLSEKVKDLCLKFCRETNETTTTELNKALSDLRDEVEDGLVEGDRMGDLVDRVQGVFTRADNERAGLIAQTESSRAHHEACIQSYKDSGVVKAMKLLPSSNACPLCESLADEEYPLDEPIYSDEDAPEEYQDRNGPPIHPGCECTLEAVLDTDYGEQPVQESADEEGGDES